VPDRCDILAGDTGRPPRTENQPRSVSIPYVLPNKDVDGYYAISSGQVRTCGVGFHVWQVAGGLRQPQTPDTANGPPFAKNDGEPSAAGKMAVWPLLRAVRALDEG
jgi:hypothetical protein